MTVPVDRYPQLWNVQFGGGDVYAAAVAVMRADRMVRRHISDVLGKHNMTMQQWTIMSILLFEPGKAMQIGQLASLLQVHSTTVTNAIDKLEPLGWMEREPVDKRTILAKLTKAGEKQLRVVHKQLVKNRFGLEHLSDAEVKAIPTALSPVYRDDV